MRIQGIPIDLDAGWLRGADGLPKEAVDFAEKLGEILAKKEDREPKVSPMTTSQVRNFFGEMRRIQMKGFEKNKGAFHMLKPKLAYSVARAKNSRIKIFQEVTMHLMDGVSDQASYNNFIAFMEAVVAYHKSNGGN